MRCNGDRTGFSSHATCTSASLCNAAKGQCESCSLGQLRCQSDQIQICNVTLTGWVKLSDCANGTRCDDAGQRCVPDGRK